MPTSYSSIYIVGPYQLVSMSIHINCPNCHGISSLTFSKLSPQIPVSSRPSSREHPSPTADLSDIPIVGAMQYGLPVKLRHRGNAQHHVARHGHGHHFPSHMVNTNYTGNLNIPKPHGQPQHFLWEGLGIPTRTDGEAQYAIHRAVKYAYDKGYQDSQKTRSQYDSFTKVLDETDRKELDELKDRLVRERMGELTLGDIGGWSASKIRGSIKEAEGARRRDQGGHRENHDRKRREKRRPYSHHRYRSPRRNHKYRGKGFEDTDSSESYDEGDHVYR